MRIFSHLGIDITPLGFLKLSFSPALLPSEEVSTGDPRSFGMYIHHSESFIYQAISDYFAVEKRRIIRAEIVYYTPAVGEVSTSFARAE